MPDHLTQEQRSRCMSRVRHEATKPELLVRRWLWSHGYRYPLRDRIRKALSRHRPVSLTIA